MGWLYEWNRTIVLEMRTEIWYINLQGILYVFFCGYKGVFTMDEYKNKLNEMINSINDLEILNYLCIIVKDIILEVESGLNECEQ